MRSGSAHDASQRLLRALERTVGAGPLRAVGAVNAMAAHVAAGAGFDALWVGSLEVSAALGVPDSNVLGVRDLADAVAAVGRVTSLPVIVDVDNAAGQLDAADRYAHDLTRAGAAALCLEDSAYPKCNSFNRRRRQSLADPRLVVRQLERMRAAAEGVVLIARTEALIAGAGLTHALERAGAYASAGADAILIHSQDPTGTQALRIADAWEGDVPLVTIPTAYPHLTSLMLGAAGYRLCIYANQLTRAAIAAMQATAHHLATGGAADGSLPVRLIGVGDLLRVADQDAIACV